MVLVLLILELFSSAAEAQSFFLISENDQVVSKTLNSAIEILKKSAPAGFLGQLSLPVQVALNYDVGCNAAWSGEKLLVYQGNEKCVSSSQIPTLLVHELGHAIVESLVSDRGHLANHLNEGLADIVAAVVLDEPLIGKGFYKDRPFHYLRNLNDDMKFSQENLRGNYATSLVLSTLAWDLYQLLLDNYSAAEAKQIFFKNVYDYLKEMVAPADNNIEKSTLDFAQKFISLFPETNWVQEILQKHGFQQKQMIQEFTYKLTAEGVEFLFPLMANSKIRILNKEYNQKSSVNKVMVTWNELNLLGTCGQQKILQPILVTPNGRHRKFSPFKFKVGKRTRLMKRYVSLSENVSIQDDVIRLPFSLDLKQDESVMGLKWLGDIEHFYPEDLRVSLISEGQFIAGFRGVDEALITREYDFTSAWQGQKASLHFQNMGKGFHGMIHSQKLEVTVLQTSCSN